MKPLSCIVLACAASAACAACAAPAGDASRIPAAALEAEPAPATEARSWQLFSELNGEQIRRRAVDVPFPSPATERNVLRWIWDGRGQWSLGADTTARASARLAWIRDADAQVVRNELVDLREAVLGFRPAQGQLAEIGRVNLRSGVALGFNPSDFLRDRSAVENGTRDPQEQRVNRLGTVIASWQKIEASYSLQLAYSPRLAHVRGDTGGAAPQSRLRLADTNNRDRWLIRSSWALGEDIRPEFVLLREPGATRVAFNLTHGLGRQATVHVEYAGGRGADTFQRLLQRGVGLGDLPRAALALRPGSLDRRWQHEFAAGGTWTSEDGLSVTLEFDHSDRAWSEGDWRDWHALGAGGPGAAALAWYLRTQNQLEQVPTARNSLFARAQWTPLAWRDLNLGALLNRNLEDGSWLVQGSIEWRLAPSQRLRALLLATGGRPDSVFGSDPARRAALLAFNQSF